MIFVDSNIPMYLMGPAYPYQCEAHSGEADCRGVWSWRGSLAGEKTAKPSDPRSRLRWTSLDEVFPIEKMEVLRAREITQNPALLSARDAVHIAVMERHGIRSILSFDGDFDRWPGLKRIHQI